MALEIRSIPVLTGETAERFVREAEENERNPQRKACECHLLMWRKYWFVQLLI